MYYEICQNEDGEILIIIDKQESDELYNPKFLYDGGDTAVICRNIHSAVELNNIPNGARIPLTTVDNILIAEMENNESYLQYNVPVKKVKNMRYYTVNNICLNDEEENNG